MVDICRVAGTLHTRAATASDLVRDLQRSGQPTPLGRAIAELGRIVQTITMLAYVSDEAAKRRRILGQLNRAEGRHYLARAVFHGRRGDLHQAYRPGQEDQLGAFGLANKEMLSCCCRPQNRYPPVRQIPTSKTSISAVA